jgi:ferric-dicitrate binding protein FerR (iron transport regulator)
MNTTSMPPAASRAAQILREEGLRAAPSSRPDDALVAVAARANRARDERRRWRRWAMVAAAAAGVVLVGSFGAHALHRGAASSGAGEAPTVTARAETRAGEVEGSVLLVRGSQTSRLDDGGEVRGGDRVVVLRDGSAALTFPTGTRLALEGGAEVSVLEQGASNVFALSAGALRAHVAKLHAGERFVVSTGDAEVEVRGTSFRVAHAPSDPACGRGTTTRVEVFEGVVAVRGPDGESRVAAGERWPGGCGAGAAESAAPSGEAAPAMAERKPSVTARPPSAARHASDLAAQNDLFDEAMAAKRRGANAEALAALERFLALYPASHLAENAAVERLRILVATDPARASAAARAYLERYPAGFARQEANGILTR